MILVFAVPLFIGVMFQQAYNMVDTVIAGYGLGDKAVAAIGTTSAIYSFVIYSANGLNSGYGIIMAKIFGSRDFGKMRRAVAVMVMLNLLTALIFTAIVLPLLGPFLQWMDIPEDIFGQAYRYIFIIFAGVFMTICYNMCAGFLSAVGNSRFSLYFLILSSCLNSVLDAVFILRIKMGVEGAALATVLATAVSVVASSIYIGKEYREFLPGRGDWRQQKKLVWEMFSTGFSMAMMNSAVSVGCILLQKSINQLGAALLTAHTASRRIYELLMMPLSTLATANATFVSQNYGARQMRRIRDTLKKVMCMELAWSVFSCVVSVFAGKWLVHMLLGTDDEYIISNAALCLNFSTFFFFPLGVLFVMRMAMQSMGYRVAPIVSSVIELAVKGLAGSFVIPRVGYFGVACTEPVVWVLCMAFLLAVYARTYHKKLGENI